MIIVTGATGPFGKNTIRFLLENGFSARNVSALVRDEKKAADLKQAGVKVKTGNYDDFGSLVEAFKGIEKLMMVSGSEVEKRDKQHDNLVNAAVKSSVNHIVYTSFARKDDNLDSPVALITRTHIETERRIAESGITYTFMRNALYAEGIPMFLGDKVTETGIFFPAGDGRVPFASRTDMAEAAAKIMMGNGHGNKVYNIVNVKNYSFGDLAAILQEITGKTIRYISPDEKDFISVLQKSGLPESAVAGVLGWARAVREGYFETSHSDMEKLLGRKPADVKSILQKIYPVKEPA